MPRSDRDLRGRLPEALSTIVCPPDVPDPELKTCVACLDRRCLVPLPLDCPQGVVGNGHWGMVCRACPPPRAGASAGAFGKEHHSLDAGVCGACARGHQVLFLTFLLLPHPPPPRPMPEWANPPWTRRVHPDAPGQRHGQQPRLRDGRPPGVVKQDKSSRGSVDTTKTRSYPRRVRMCKGEGPIGTANDKQTSTTAACQSTPLTAAPLPPQARVLTFPPPPPAPSLPHSRPPSEFDEHLQNIDLQEDQPQVMTLAEKKAETFFVQPAPVRRGHNYVEPVSVVTSQRC